MMEVIAEPREEVSAYAPKMYRIHINPELIGTVIGPGGKMIRKIQEEAGGATIDIEEDGTVFVGGINEEVARKAIGMIEGLTKEVKVGEIYTGKVTRLLNFGAFVEFLPGKEGLVHISQLAEDHIDRVEDAVDVGDEVTVMVSEVDNLGRINLSRRAVLLGEEPPPASATSGGGRPPRGGGFGGGRPGGGGGGGRGPRPERGGGDRGGGQRPRSGGGGFGGGRSGGGGFGGGGRNGPSAPLGGVSRGWTRRTDGTDEPVAPPPPPRPGLGGVGNYGEDD